MSKINTVLMGSVIETESGRKLKVVEINDSEELICITGKSEHIEYVPVVELKDGETNE